MCQNSYEVQVSVTGAGPVAITGYTSIPNEYNRITHLKWRKLHNPRYYMQLKWYEDTPEGQFYIKYRCYAGLWFNDNTLFPVYVRMYPNGGAYVSKRWGKVLGRTPHHACPPSNVDTELREAYVYVIGLIPNKPWQAMDVPAKWLRRAKQEDYEAQVRKDYE